MTTPGSMQIVARDAGGAVIRYQTQGDPLGKGSGGTVWLAVRLPGAEDAAADEARRVAIKLTPHAKWKGHLAEEARILFSLQEREAQLVAITKGVYRPVRLLSGTEPFEVDDHYRSALIELEYLDGKTLKQWFDETWWVDPAPASAVIVDEVLTLARQLAEALIQIQSGPELPLIHRDIKPENLMRTSRGLRLFDFNVAHEHEGGDRTQHVGTPGYMAPEVMAGGDYNTAADLYSVGAVLWEVAMRRRFEEQSHTERRSGKLHLRWPIGGVSAWPTADQRAVGDLLEGLVVDREFRLVSARALLQSIEEIETNRRPAPTDADAFGNLDMVEVLAELRPSALAAVVSDTVGEVSTQRRQVEIARRMHVDDPLEGWLERELTAAAGAPPGVPALYVLAGNAGDGKSHLLREVVRRRLGARPELVSRLRVVADATHALRPDGSQRERLAEFFAAFADTDPVADTRVHVIAMNTGMVIRFFDEEPRFQRLYAVLQERLGLRRAAIAEKPSPWRVEVVNLDLRDLLAPGPDAAPSFADRMLARLDPEDPGGLAALRWEKCQECPALSLCPVAFNLRALAMPVPRRAVMHALRRVALDNEVHPSPRNLWGFLYRLATGGIERYDVPDRGGRSPCEVIRAKVANANKDNLDGAWLLAGQFTELMFQQPDAGAPWLGLVKHDPAYCGAPDIDALHTRISVKTELDNDPKLVETLGGVGRSLAGLALDALTSLLPTTEFKGRRRDAAIRRHAMFHAPTLAAWITHDGSQDFLPLLSAYDAYSRDPDRLTTEQQDQLRKLRELVQIVFLHGHGRQLDRQNYLQVSQPNGRAKSVLLVRVDRTSLEPIFRVQKIVSRDVHVLAHRERLGLLKLLGHRPNQVTLTIEGVRLTVDLALYEFLLRVSEGQRPSKRAMAQFQALAFVGERVGNRLARGGHATELFVWNEAKGLLHRLAADDFGHPRLQTVR